MRQETETHTRHIDDEDLQRGQAQESSHLPTHVYMCSHRYTALWKSQKEIKGRITRLEWILITGMAASLSALGTIIYYLIEIAVSIAIPGLE